jgi:hypothetical protein
MVRRSTLITAAAAAVALLAPAAASAAPSAQDVVAQARAAVTSPTTPKMLLPEDGLRVVGVRGGAVLRFTGQAAKAAKYWTGRRLDVVCDTVGDQQDGVSVGGHVLMRRFNGRTLSLGPVAGTDTCSVTHPRGPHADADRVALVAVSAAGSTWIDELEMSTLLLVVTSGGPSGPAGHVPTIDQVLAQNAGITKDGAPLAEPLIVALPGPDASPPSKKIGYWSDGDQHSVIAVLSSAGRRLFVETEADHVIRTNVLEYFTYLFLGA